MAVLQLLFLPIRWIITIVAFIALFALLLLVMGTLYTYISWAFAPGVPEALFPFPVLLLATYPIARAIFRRREQQLPKSEIARRHLRNRLTPTHMPGPAFWTAVAVASLGFVGFMLKDVCKFAVYSLEVIGEPSLGLLCHVAEREERVQKNAAFDAITNLVPDSPEAAEWMYDHRQEAESQVWKALWFMNYPAPAKIVYGLTSSDKQTQEFAARILAEVPPGDDQIGKLISALQIDNGYVTGRVADCLKKMGPRLAGKVPTLIDLARKKERGSNSAADVLASVGPALGEHADDVVSLAVESDNPAFLTDAIVACGAPAIPPLLKLLTSKEIRWKGDTMVIGTLAKLMPLATAEQAATIRQEFYRLLDRDDLHSIVVAAALLRIGDETGGAVVVLSRALTESRQSTAHQSARYQLIELGPLAAPMIPKYRSMLSSKDSETEGDALQIVGALKEAAGPLVPEMVNLLRKTTNQNVQAHYLEVLAKLGTTAAAADPAIVEMMPTWTLYAQVKGAWARALIAGTGKPLADFVMTLTPRQTTELEAEPALQWAMLQVSESLGGSCHRSRSRTRQTRSGQCYVASRCGRMSGTDRPGRTTPTRSGLHLADRLRRDGGLLAPEDHHADCCPPAGEADAGRSHRSEQAGRQPVREHGQRERDADPVTLHSASLT